MAKDNTSDYSLSTPIKGMNKDAHVMYMGKDSYSHALNATYESFSGEGIPLLQNDGSNILGIVFPEGYNVIKALSIPELNRTLFFLVGKESSEIGEVVFNPARKSLQDTGSNSICEEGCAVTIDESLPLEQQVQSPIHEYKTIVNSPCLGFSIDHPIDAEYKIMDCSLDVYWVDNYNPDRFVYFDLDSTDTAPLKVQKRFLIVDKFEVPQGSFGSCPVPVYSDRLDCNAIKLQPNIERFCLRTESVVGGGEIEEGAYQFIACYSDVEGNPLTSYSPATNPICIFEPGYKREGQTIKTNKAIKLSIAGPDPRISPHKYFNIVCAKTVNNIVTFQLVGTYPVDITTITYTGKFETAISEQEVFAKYPYYKHSKSITKSNNYLFRSRLTGWKELNLQQAANKVKLNWITTQVPEGIYLDPVEGEKYRTYPRDEVFPFGIVYEFDNGDETAVYPLVGREATPEDVAIINSDDIIEDEATCETPSANVRWKTYNTAKILNSPRQPYDPCKYSIWEIGEFAYYESIETYPNKPEIWGDLACKPIRHFKFPDSVITHIHDGKDGQLSYEKQNMLYPLGVMVNHQSVIDGLQYAVDNQLITKEDLDRIRSYRIVRGNRAGNKSIIARGLLYDVWSYRKEKDPNKYYYPNYPFNDLRPDPYLSPIKDTYVDDTSVQDKWKIKFTPEGRYTFHSPDTHFSRPTLGNVLKLETLEYGQSEGFFNQVEDHAKYRLLSTFGAAMIADMGVIMGVLAAWPPRFGYHSVLGTGTSDYLPSIMPDVFKGMMGYIEFHKAIKESIEELMGYKNYMYQYQAVGKYNCYSMVDNTGNKIREITTAGYLSPDVQSILTSQDNESDSSIQFNNWNRESSVYVGTDISKGYLPVPWIRDESRFLASEVGYCHNDNTHVRRPVSAYYASIKRNILNQYGNIYNIEWLETGMCSIPITQIDAESKEVNCPDPEVVFTQEAIPLSATKFFVDYGDIGKYTTGKPDGAKILTLYIDFSEPLPKDIIVYGKTHITCSGKGLKPSYWEDWETIITEDNVHTRPPKGVIIPKGSVHVEIPCSFGGSGGSWDNCPVAGWCLSSYEAVDGTPIEINFNTTTC